MTVVFRNILRRKLRSLLTISGITIGILAFVVMGSFAEKMNNLLGGAIDYMTGQIVVTEKGSTGGMGGFGAAGLFNTDKVAEIEAIDGVSSVVPEIDMLFDEEMDMSSVSMPDTILGLDFSKNFDNKNFKDLKLAKGRWIESGELGKAVMGYDIAKKRGGEEIGNKVTIRGKEFEVVGVIEKTLSGPENIVMIAIEDARDLYFESQPFLSGIGIDKSKVATSAAVFWKDGVNPDDLAQTIKDTVPNVEVTSPIKLREQIDQSMVMFNMIVLSSALIALVVGSLAVINTMIMSVSERTREIGIKKAIGASSLRIMFEFIQESAVIGFIGGAMGLFWGWCLVGLFNLGMSSQGVSLFYLSPRLAAFSLVFAVFLGTFAGLYPAWRASRLDPVKALKYE